MDNQVSNFLKIIRTALHNDMSLLLKPDWKVLFHYARHHSILPLFYEGCNKYNEYHSIPDNARNYLGQEALATIIGQARRTEAFLHIYDKLIAAGIKPLVIKGLICRNLYGELEDHRPSGDEDIYIRIEEFEQCREILNKFGFIMEDTVVSDKILSEIQHIGFTNSEIGLLIEVHVSLMGNYNQMRRTMNSYFTDSFEKCFEVDIKGHQIYTLNPTDHYLFMFFHLFKHFTSSGVGFRQIIDLLINNKYYHDQIEWKVVESGIHSLSAERLYADILRIGNYYLGFEPLTDIQDGNCEELIEDLMKSGVFGNSSSEQMFSGRILREAMEGRKVNVLNNLFPKASSLKPGYPVLYEKPYLLPVIWLRRLFKFLLKKNNKRKLISEGFKIGEQRKQLLKKYGIIS